MGFIIDQQTLDDLGIFGRRDTDSVFGVFNKTATRGGALQLETFFRYPLAGGEAISGRLNIIRSFQELNLEFPFSGELFDAAEHYLENFDERTALSHDGPSLGRRFNNLIGADNAYREIARGVTAVLRILGLLERFLDDLPGDTPFGREAAKLRDLLALLPLEYAAAAAGDLKLSYEETAVYDRKIRYESRDLIKRILYDCYTLDVYVTVATVAKSRAFAFPEVLQDKQDSIYMEGLFHPQVQGAVSNDIAVTPSGRVLFLTGANMAGKSTLMKSIGIAVYLAHVGFPVPAKAMAFSVRDGLLSSINLADNLGMGYSHFYAEVLRVKKVAELLGGNKKMFILFDELFRGTNVKDAHEATVAITKAFSMKPSCMFVVSTHIIEAADDLKSGCRFISYRYLPTIMEGSVPRYTYKLKEGVTDDRHGMVIIRQEGISDILARGNQTGTPDQPAGSGFMTDKQTLDDLNLLGRYRSGSVFSIFDETATKGGSSLLERWFQQPLTDAGQINERSATFRYFHDRKITFPCDKKKYAIAFEYLSSGGGSFFDTLSNMTLIRMRFLIGLREEYEQTVSGLVHAIGMLKTSFDFFNQFLSDPLNPLSSRAAGVLELFGSKPIKQLLNEPLPTERSLSFTRVLRYSLLLKSKYHRLTSSLTQLIHEIDVYTAVSKVAARCGFHYAQAFPATKSLLSVTDMFHPAVKGAVPNSLEMSEENNFLFLTGANMAGKSTLMKTFGITLYLAHMGFPVPAASMRFSVKDGLFSSINVPDNLAMGYSHFYAEVLRVKNVAEAVSGSGNVVVIFDELFKGTNVKDAYDATLSVSRDFSAYKDSLFIISTHIVEVGEALKRDGDTISFGYMPTLMDGNRAVYPYRLAEGISSDRHGMMIVKNEGILELLR